MFFDVLKSNNLGRVLAEPNLVTTSGTEASFQAGGGYPIPVPQSGVGGGHHHHRLQEVRGAPSFTPTVLDEGKIAMKVNPEVSDTGLRQCRYLPGSTIPGLTVRRMSTNLEVKDGQTFAMAGLLKNLDRNNVSKVPVLGDVPVLGNLFRSSQLAVEPDGVVVLVTPHIAKPLAPNQPGCPTTSGSPTTPRSTSSGWIRAAEARSRFRSSRRPNRCRWVLGFKNRNRGNR